MNRPADLSTIADSILYVSSLLRDQPRWIDHYVDYFGEWPGGARPEMAGDLPRSA
ncbi:MAG TPA: hypothetical protein VFX28_13425 [Methylomirabilota bacterium]|nr:hypothetical protein [Methylomirabilota bacterium]